MDQDSQEIINLAISKVLDYTSKKIVRTFLANGKIINSRASASTNGIMDDPFKENGLIVK